MVISSTRYEFALEKSVAIVETGEYVTDSCHFARGTSTISVKRHAVAGQYGTSAIV